METIQERGTVHTEEIATSPGWGKVTVLRVKDIRSSSP